MIKLIILLFPMSVFATDFAIPDDLKTSPAFVGVCNDPACNYKKPNLDFENAAYLTKKSYGIEYALLIALGIGIGDQLLRHSFDLSDAAGIAASKFLYVRYEF
jgi:hypothetical protein